MNQYVVAFISFFENELKQELVPADSAIDAVRSCSFGIDWVVEDTEDYEKAREVAFNADCMFSVIKVS